MSGPRKDFSKVPGVVIDHSPATLEKYIGSPSIVVTGDGELVASHDYFGPGGDRGRYNSMVVFGSSDGGSSWQKLASIDGQFWSNLFCHRGELYLMGTSGRNQDITIRRSTDGGRNWTVPGDGQSGVLTRGIYHTAPVPTVIHGGRVWRAMENREMGGHRPFIMSAPVDEDLLMASSWSFSDERSKGPEEDPRLRSWREGNAVAKPDGRMCIVMRVGLLEGHGTAAMINVSDDGGRLSFDPGRDYLNFPGGSGKKFTIRFDEETGRYWSVVNPIHPADLEYLEGKNSGKFRNCLAVSSSQDLVNWTVNGVIAYHPEYLHHGFQYPDWVPDGDDMLLVSRTSYDDGLGGAVKTHDANFLTFHRVPGFRDLADVEFDWRRVRAY